MPGLLDLKSCLVLVSAIIRTDQTAKLFCTKRGINAVGHLALDEFSVIDAGLIKGMTGDQRKPFVKADWDDVDPQRRFAQDADTFAEFEHRVSPLW